MAKNFAKNVSAQRAEQVKKNPTLKRRVMQLPKMNADDLAFRSGRDGYEGVTSIDIKTFSGETFPGDKRGSNSAQLVIDFEKMSNLGENPTYSGSAEGRPVNVVFQKDETSSEAKEVARISLDLNALADASFKEKQANADAKGLAPVDPKKEGRIDLKYFFPAAHNGAAGLGEAGVKSNIAVAAAQRYILTAPKAESEANDPKIYPKQDVIDNVAKIYMDTYADVMGKAIKGELVNGMTTKEVVENGKTVRQGGEPIQGTNVPNLGEKFGLRLVEVDGATVVGTTKELSADQKKELNTILRSSFEKAFSTTLTQNIGPEYASQTAGKAIGNMLSAQPYVMTPQSNPNIMLVQPNMVAKVSPFARALENAMDAAMHTSRNGKARDVKEMYNPTVIANAKNLIENNAYSLSKELGLEGESTDKKMDEVRKAQDKQLAAIESAIKAEDKAVAKSAKSAKTAEVEAPEV